MSEPHRDAVPTSAGANHQSKTFFLTLIVLSLIAVGATFQPIAAPLLLGAVLAGLFWPLRLKLDQKLGKHPVLNVSLIVSGIVLVLLGIAFVLGEFTVTEAGDAYDFVLNALRGDGIRPLLDVLPPSLQNSVEEAIASLPNNGEELHGVLSDALESHGERAASATLRALTLTGQLAVATALALVALFVLLLKGQECLSWIDKVTPATRGQLAELFDGCRKVTSSVITSTLLSSFVQALAALVGYLIASVPHPLFFAFITFLFGCVPVVGAATICTIAAALMLITGSFYWALFLFIWGTVIVGLADNVVKPLLMREDAKLDATVVFFSLVGGLLAFGTIGLIAGPLFVCMLMSALRIYRRDYMAPDADAGDSSGSEDRAALELASNPDGQANN